MLLPGVQYLNGQRFDLRAITQAAQRAGCRVGFDLAHAIGNVPLALHDCGADFAVWCHYKYLNAGPGAVGGCFVHERHARDFDLLRLAGWWGHDKASRFRMPHEFAAAARRRGLADLATRRFSRSRRCLLRCALFEPAGMPRACAPSRCS